MENEKDYLRRQDEPIEEYLWRLGQAREDGAPLTWQQISEYINKSLTGDEESVSLNRCRKKYKRMKNAMGQNSIFVLEDSLLSEYTKHNYVLMEKRRIRLNDARNEIKKDIRDDARTDEMYEILYDAVKTYEPSEIPKRKEPESLQSRSMIAMLGDLHYGMSFSSVYGKYNKDIANKRVIEYADNIVRIAKSNNALDTCYVALMGDLINGNIHDNVRVENKENVIEQVMGASDLCARFIGYLSTEFKNVIVYSVGGNHSRVDQDLKKVLKDERLDVLVPWHCKTAMRMFPNVKFEDSIDATLATMNIYGKNYAVIHGDMDKNVHDSAVKLSTILHKDIYAMLSAHNHTYKSSVGDVVSIQNGCVCGSGGDFCERNRMHAPAEQTCMVVSDKGIDMICPIVFNGSDAA